MLGGKAVAACWSGREPVGQAVGLIDAEAIGTEHGSVRQSAPGAGHKFGARTRTCSCQFAVGGGGRFQTHNPIEGTSAPLPLPTEAAGERGACGSDQPPSDGDPDFPTSDANKVLHQPVMVTEVLAYLAPAPGKIILDATLGVAGHARVIAPRLVPGGILIGLDRDPAMAAASKSVLAGVGGSVGVRIFVANYAEMGEVLCAAGVPVVDGILMDLGVCSAQLDAAERGFSYRADGPLSMQMTPEAGASAADLVNTLPEAELERIIREYGEERWARRIARAIVVARQRSPITRTLQLAEIIAQSVPPGPRRSHPARRTFQALRIATNRELEHLKSALTQIHRYLRPGGRLVVIAYHSLEDRLVKMTLRRGAQAGWFAVLTPKVVRPSAAEAQQNPRARSAKLRAAERCAGLDVRDAGTGREVLR